MKYHTLQKKVLLSIIWSKYCNKDEKIFKQEESIKILKILGLIDNTEQYQIYVQRKHKSRILTKKLDKTRSYFFFYVPIALKKD